LLSVHASSSIFLVIIALWAAYLVPGAIKRRRRTASARIADRDSAALRVVVRRAGTASAATGPGTLPVALETSSRPVLGGATAPALPAAAGARSAAAGATGATGSATPAGRRGTDVVRRRRRLVLVLLVLAATGALAGALDLVPALPALLPSLALLLVLGALARHGASRTSAPVVVAHPEPVAAPVGAAAPAPVAAADVTTVLPAQREAPAAPAAPAAEGSWEPVAVPLPTYLLKPKAPKAPERPLPAPVPVAAVHVDETPTVLIDLREGARAVNE